MFNLFGNYHIIYSPSDFSTDNSTAKEIHERYEIHDSKSFLSFYQATYYDSTYVSTDDNNKKLIFLKVGLLDMEYFLEAPIDAGFVRVKETNEDTILLETAFKSEFDAPLRIYIEAEKLDSPIKYINGEGNEREYTHFGILINSPHLSLDELIDVFRTIKQDCAL